MNDKPAAATIKRLGLTAEADRDKSWVALYGAKLGVTEVKAADPAARAVDTWHEAMGELMVRVHDAYDDPKDETHAQLPGGADGALPAPGGGRAAPGAEGPRQADGPRARLSPPGRNPLPARHRGRLSVHLPNSAQDFP